MARFTPTQGRYLAYIQAYTDSHGIPPAESEIAAAMCVAPPSVNQMVKALEKKGLILRQPGQARSLRVLVPADEIPPWGGRKRPTYFPQAQRDAPPLPPPAPPASLYVLSVSLVLGPLGPEFVGKRMIRVLELRGDQALDDLHKAIFQAYDRTQDRPYEFHLGKRSFAPPIYGIPGAIKNRPKCHDARTTTLDDLAFEKNRVFGYWFDSGDGWYHHLAVERIEQAIPTVTYPRVIRRTGKSPPQFDPQYVPQAQETAGRNTDRQGTSKRTGSQRRKPR